MEFHLKRNLKIIKRIFIFSYNFSNRYDFFIKIYINFDD